MSLIKFLHRSILAISFLLLASCTDPRANQPTLLIAAASNMQSVIQLIATEFSNSYDLDVEVASAASGLLAAQVRQGAPFDVFISANMRYPLALENEGLTLGSPKTYAIGTLILWWLDNTEVSDGLHSLEQASIENIALANPEVAPYGIAAMQALQSLNLYEHLREKLVFGESIAQVNQYVAAGAVQVGITSQSVTYSDNLIDKGKSVIVDRSLYSPIEQAVVLLANGALKNRQAAKLFHEYLFSNTAKQILNSHGYQAI